MTERLVCWDCARSFWTDDPFAVQCPLCVERDGHVYRITVHDDRTWTNRRCDMRERLSVPGDED